MTSNHLHLTADHDPLNPHYPGWIVITDSPVSSRVSGEKAKCSEVMGEVLFGTRICLSCLPVFIYPGTEDSYLHELKL